MSEQTWRKSRGITRRVIVEGELMLETPASFGNGDADGVTDLSLLRDPLEGRALLMGTSIAGALRNYLRELEEGFGVRYEDRSVQTKQPRRPLSLQLFGGERRDDNGDQSPLIVDDALGKIPQTELRDGVSIDPVTRTAADEQKYDIELLRVGTTFALRFELLISEDSGELRKAVALALSGFQEAGQICLGARKRRGFGECSVNEWRVTEYDLTTKDGLFSWLTGEGVVNSGEDIVALLYPSKEMARAVRHFVDQRYWFRVQAAFSLDSSLLIRSGTGASLLGPDDMHIHRLEVDSDARMPVLPGTSLAGAIRHRALRIAQTVLPDGGADLVSDLFGTVQQAENSTGASDDEYKGSRVVVRETIINPERVHHIVQNRIRIDRFTGGVLDNFLFDEAPLFEKGEADDEQALIGIDLTVRNPEAHDIGLLLLVLKDLWLADLPLGGGANVGRGRLHGRYAKLTIHDPRAISTGDNSGADSTTTWQIKQESGGKLAVSGSGSVPELEEFVMQLNRYQIAAEGEKNE